MRDFLVAGKVRRILKECLDATDFHRKAVRIATPAALKDADEGMAITEAKLSASIKLLNQIERQQ